jgi:multicomponent K+:H+ antiporter subunit E
VTRQALSPSNPVRRWRRRLLPAPALSVVLLVAWLMLSGSLATGHLLIAVGAALAVPWLTLRRDAATAPASTRTDSLAPRRPARAAARLAVVVLYDIVRANFEVARRVLGPATMRQPRWLWLPLRVRSARGVAALAGIITLTPGTVSCQLASNRRHLLLHALHCPDAAAEAALVAAIQARYEQALLEIFG